MHPFVSVCFTWALLELEIGRLRVDACVKASMRFDQIRIIWWDQIIAVEFLRFSLWLGVYHCLHFAHDIIIMVCVWCIYLYTPTHSIPSNPPVSRHRAHAGMHAMHATHARWFHSTLSRWHPSSLQPLVHILAAMHVLVCVCVCVCITNVRLERGGQMEEESRQGEKEREHGTRGQRKAEDEETCWGQGYTSLS